MRLGAVGARGALMEQDATGEMDLALKADAFFVRMDSEQAANSVETTADASRVRLVLEGGRAFEMDGGATLRPSLELGLRHDGGDAETGAGVELGGGVAFADAATGLSIEAKARMLVAHADSGYEEWGGERDRAARPRRARAGPVALALAHHRLRGERHRAAVGDAAPARARARGGVRGGAGLHRGGRLRARALRRALHGHAERGARARRRRRAGLAHRLAADLGGARRPRLRGQPRRHAPRARGRRRARARGDAPRHGALVGNGARCPERPVGAGNETNIRSVVVFVGNTV